MNESSECVWAENAAMEGGAAMGRPDW